MARRLPQRRSPRAGPAPAVIGLSAFTLVWAAVALAGQVTDARVYRRSDRLEVDVAAADLLDERTAMTVDSGLPGTCVYWLRLEDRERRAVAEQWVELSLRLDLWENVYRLDGPGGSRTFATLAGADSAWSHLEAHGLTTVDRLQPGAEYRLLVGVAVQPLAPEDRERMSRYVSRNSGGAGEELALDVGKVLSRLFRGPRLGERAESHAGEFFRLSDLEVLP